MACTIYKVKHLFWYMVLATVGVVISASNSPQTKVKMIVASQHAPTNAQEKRQLRPSSSITEETNGGDEERMTPFEKMFEALTSGAKADMDLDLKLTLPSGHTIETLTSGAKADKNANRLPKSAALTSGVDKNLKLSLAPPSENMVEELTTGNGVDMNLELSLAPSSGNTLEEFTTGDGVDKNLKSSLAPSSGNALEEFTTGAQVDKNANNMPESAALTTDARVDDNLEVGLGPSSEKTIEELTTGARVDKNTNNLPESAALATNDGVGEIKKILDEGASIIEAAIKIKFLEEAAKKLKESLALKWSDEMMVRLEKMLLAGKKDVTQILTEVKEWNQESGVGFPIPLLFDKISKHFTERELAEQLLLAQDEENVKETAKMLADYQMLKWKKMGKTGEDVFQLLELEYEGIQLVGAPLYTTFVSYVRMLNGTIKGGKSPYKLAYSALEKYFKDEELLFLFHAASDVIGNKRVEHLIRSLNTIRKSNGLDMLTINEAVAPKLRKRKRNDGEASVPTKRQRNDDDQKEGLQASIGRG
ncbi:hypothetical protein DD238_005294 [Peronospora effusa]|uniref:RxLR effector protein n=1 Tax=Peronospora effusa TaxID=542832 RepID=A0A3M6VVE2_9STRA|nr:hypothetical protein DD238_005294 [Peronospora effusa]RQM18608.1 hypothetical protein DD237_001535 [Peronospora effusa]